MMSRAGLLIAGLALGIAVTSAVFLTRNRPSAGPDMPPAHVATETPISTAMAVPSDVAVQLTAEEQRQIGVQTTAVRRQAVTEQITP
jgi:hypothetical protein